MGIICGPLRTRWTMCGDLTMKSTERLNKLCRDTVEKNGTVSLSWLAQEIELTGLERPEIELLRRVANAAYEIGMNDGQLKERFVNET